MEDIHLFDIALKSMNLFSFMLGMTFAAFQSYNKRTTFGFVVGYFACLAAWYYFLAQH